MVGVYAPDGSLRVTLVEDGQPVSTSDTLPGVYARDGSIRVTIVGISGDGAIVSDQDSAQIAVSGSYTDTVTFTVLNNVITEIALS